MARPMRVLISRVPSNTFRHIDAGGVLAIWSAGNELACQVQDTGHISGPLAGRRRPASDAGGGHGLWVVHQLCDLVELRSGPARTVIRLHMRLDSPSARDCAGMRDSAGEAAAPPGASEDGGDRGSAPAPLIASPTL